jgi:hypothetical protein
MERLPPMMKQRQPEWLAPNWLTRKALGPKACELPKHLD